MRYVGNNVRFEDLNPINKRDRKLRECDNLTFFVLIKQHAYNYDHIESQSFNKFVHNSRVEVDIIYEYVNTSNLCKYNTYDMEKV